MLLLMISLAQAGLFSSSHPEAVVYLPPDGSQPNIGVLVDGLEPVEGAECRCELESLSCGVEPRIDRRFVRLNYNGDLDERRTGSGLIDVCVYGKRTFDVFVEFRARAVRVPWVADDVIVWPVHETAAESISSTQFVEMDVPEDAVFPEPREAGAWPPAVCTPTKRGGVQAFKPAGELPEDPVCFTSGDRTVTVRYLPFGSP